MYFILKEVLMNETGLIIDTSFFVVNSNGDFISIAFQTFEAALAELEMLTENNLKNTIKTPRP